MTLFSSQCARRNDFVFNFRLNQRRRRHQLTKRRSRDRPRHIFAADSRQFALVVIGPDANGDNKVVVVFDALQYGVDAHLITIVTRFAIGKYHQYVDQVKGDGGGVEVFVYARYKVKCLFFTYKLDKKGDSANLISIGCLFHLFRFSNDRLVLIA